MGKCHAASDTIIISINGKQAHGAYPQDGIDAILISAHVITALQSLISRNLSPFETAVLKLGIIEGGTAGNIVCDQVTIKGTLRTLDQTTRVFMKKRIIEVAGKTLQKLLEEVQMFVLKKAMHHLLMLTPLQMLLLMSQGSYLEKIM